MPPARNRERTLRAVVVAAWTGRGHGRRTRPVFAASICPGVLGCTLARVSSIALLRSYVATSAAVFLLTTAVQFGRGRAG